MVDSDPECEIPIKTVVGVWALDLVDLYLKSPLMCELIIISRNCLAMERTVPLEWVEPKMSNDQDTENKMH